MSGSADIFQQYNATIAQQIVEQLKPFFESLSRQSTRVEQRLFDIEQASVYLGRTPKAIRLLIHRGKVPVTKIDGKVQIDRATLDKLIDDATFYSAN
jgi:hypothetical protein